MSTFSELHGIEHEGQPTLAGKLGYVSGERVRVIQDDDSELLVSIGDGICGTETVSRSAFTAQTFADALDEYMDAKADMESMKETHPAGWPETHRLLIEWTAETRKVLNGFFRKP